MLSCSRGGYLMTKAGVESFVIFQALTGIGHLARCSVLAEALSSISHVTMLSGGTPVEGYVPPAGVDFIQLPAVRRAVKPGEAPVPVDAGVTAAEIERIRSELLVDSYLRIRPGIVIVEYYPFSPMRFADTLNALFEVINQEQKRPLVISSVRTYPRRAWDADNDAPWINEQLRKNFTCVLHHADPKLFPLSSLGSQLQTALSGIAVSPTGFIRRPVTRRELHRPTQGLLLTVGAGDTGPHLLKRWVNAARAGSPDLFPVNAVCGPLMDSEDRKDIRALEGAGITVHDHVANMDELISDSRAVVCLGGYNSLVEALSLNKPVLAFPNGGKGDQNFQVGALHAQGMLLRGDPAQSDNEMTALMNEVLSFRLRHPIDCDGANRSVEIVRDLMATRA